MPEASSKEIVEWIPIIASLILAGFAIFGFQIVKSIIRREVGKETENWGKKILAMADIREAYQYWSEGNIENAIAYSEASIKYLDEGLYRVIAIYNLAYYYAYGRTGEDPFWENRNRAISLADESLTFAFLYPNETTTIKINYGYVMMRYTQTRKEGHRSIAFLESLLNRPGLQDEERKEIQDYAKEARRKWP